MTEPQRVCVVCRTLRVRTDLLRLVRLKETNRLQWAQPGLGGKGVYLCLAGECAQRVVREKKFRRLVLETMEDECRRRFHQQFDLAEEIR